VLGLCVFVQYAEDVDHIFQRHGVHHHLFADDMQGHCSGRLDDVPEVVSRLESCIIDIYAWCGAKRLQLNDLFFFCRQLVSTQLRGGLGDLVPSA